MIIANTPAPIRSATSKHIPELDGVRGLAILAVTIYRFSREIPIDTSLGFILFKGFSLGSRGVDLFFVLSGFLITGVLLDAKSSPHRYRNFYARRSLRISPLYFAALLVCVVGIPAAMGSRNPFEQATDQQFYLWTYLTNVRMSWLGQWNFGRLDHFWSLAVEEHFYFIWPWIVFTIPDRWLLRISAVGFFASALSRICFASLSTNTVAPNVFSWFRFDALLIGAMLVIHLRSSGTLPWRYWRLNVLFFVSLLASILLAASDRRLLTLAETSFAVTFALLIAVVLRPESERSIAWVFRLGTLRTLGKYSYAMYVIQNPLIPLVALLPVTATLMESVGGRQSVLAQLAYATSMSFLTFLLALASWHMLEKHFLKWKRLFATKPSSDLN